MGVGGGGGGVGVRGYTLGRFLAAPHTALTAGSGSGRWVRQRLGVPGPMYAARRRQDCTGVPRAAAGLGGSGRWMCGVLRRGWDWRWGAWLGAEVGLAVGGGRGGGSRRGAHKACGLNPPVALPHLRIAPQTGAAPGPAPQWSPPPLYWAEPPLSVYDTPFACHYPRLPLPLGP